MGADWRRRQQQRWFAEQTTAARDDVLRHFADRIGLARR